MKGSSGWQGMRINASMILGPILLGTGLLLLWLLWQSPLALLWHKPHVPSLLRLIPAHVDQAVILTAPPQQLTALLQTLTPPSHRRRHTQAWRTWLERDLPLRPLWQSSHLHPPRDVLPWLGSEAAYVRQGQDELLILSTRNLQQSNQFLNLLWQTQDLAGSPLHLTTYKGVQVVSIDLDSGITLGTAALGTRYVLLSNQPDLILSSIDTWERPQHSLQGDPQWQQMPAPSRGQIGWWFERGQRYLSLGISRQGVTLQGTVPAYASLGSPHRPQLLKHLPPHPQAFLTGTTLNQTWSNDQHSLPPWLWQPWQIWLDQQPLPWLDILPPTQEFALALLAEPKTPTPAWVYVTADPVADTIAQILARAGWIPHPQGPLTTWDPPHAKLSPLVTSTDHGRFYLSSSLSALQRAVRGTPTRLFTAHLPIQNLGYFYTSFSQDEHLTLIWQESEQPMLQQVKGLLRLG